MGEACRCIVALATIPQVPARGRLGDALARFRPRIIARISRGDLGT